MKHTITAAYVTLKFAWQTVFLRSVLIALLLVPLAALHAADLESQLPGYWQPDMEKTLAQAKKANREMDKFQQALLGKMIFEFQKDKMLVHGPPGNRADNPPVPYTVKGVDQAANTLILSAGGKEMKVRFDHGQMALEDPKTGWTIFNRMSKEDFDKYKPAGAKTEMETGGKGPAAGKLEDVSAQPIPDQPAAGKIQGKEFKVEKATLEENRLILRQGEAFSSHFGKFEIDFRGKNSGSYAGKAFTVNPDQTPGIDITLAYPGEKKGSIKTRTHTKKYTMSLEFGTAKDGKLRGKIHLRLPDEAGSLVVGTFEAEIK